MLQLRLRLRRLAMFRRFHIGELTVDGERAMTSALLAMTFVAAVGLVWDIGRTFRGAMVDGFGLLTIEVTAYAAFIAFIVYGNVLYQFGRLAYLKRLARHRPAPDSELRVWCQGQHRPVTFLIPSYKEEERVIRQSLLSAALQEYPVRHVTLLIDDPPEPSSPQDAEGLRRSRTLPHELQALLDDAHLLYGTEGEEFFRRQMTGGLNLHQECLDLANRYRGVAQWFETQAKHHPINDHTDALFVEKVLRARAHRYHELAHEFSEIGRTVTTLPSAQIETRLAQEYHRLRRIFRVTIGSFERKRYGNLSHEPNKAMNLNAYIALMGHAFEEVERDGERYLMEAHSHTPTLIVPDAVYLVTLDADSLLLPEYALRLIHILEQPGHERVAVIQTPYSAIPNPASQLERIAGAQTDVQFFAHQGSTVYGATFWVGASAVLRKAALDEMQTVEQERGYPIKKYIRDGTLTEDTESTVHLLPKGWTVYSYPERLSYSATPADFGALLVQRGRWANGGLLVLPALLRYAFARPWSWTKVRELVFRFYYVFALAAGSLGFVLVFAWPYNTSTSVNSAWVIPAALPFYFLYSRDLRWAGYQRKTDFFRVYALNLLLVSISICGTLKSLHQAVTGKKSAFTRTPKIAERTTAPAAHLCLQYGLLAWLLFGAIWDIVKQHWFDAAFAALNGGFLLYAIGTYIGFRNSAADVGLGWNNLHRNMVQRWRKKRLAFKAAA